MVIVHITAAEVEISNFVLDFAVLQNIKHVKIAVS
jgi:hypothetical protein